MTKSEFESTFQPFIQCFDRGPNLSPQAIRLWWQSFRPYEVMHFAKVCGETARRLPPAHFPIIDEMLARVREITREAVEATRQPFTISEVRPASEFGRRCQRHMLRVLEGDLPVDRAIRRQFKLARIMQVDLYRDCRPAEAQQLAALQDKYKGDL